MTPLWMDVWLLTIIYGACFPVVLLCYLACLIVRRLRRLSR